MKVYGNLASRKSIGFIFSTAFAHFMSLCHILVILKIFEIFILIICYGGLWPVIFDYDLLKFQVMVSSF